MDVRTLPALTTTLFVCSAAGAVAWRASTGGPFQSGVVPVDLQLDLVRRDPWHFFGSALSFSGDNLLARSRAGGHLISASDGYRLGLSLAGLEGRVRVAPGWVDAGGDIQGMAFGGYGHYLQDSANVGAGPQRVQLRADYRWPDADVHENTSSTDRIGVAARIRGPVLGSTFRLP